MTLHEDPLCLHVYKELASFQKRYLERIEKEQQRLKACKINTVFQSKRAQELNLHSELSGRLAELSQKENHLNRICSSFATGLTITDGDQQRLDSAKEMYEIGKKLTGIRFDYSAPANVTKGYIKSESRRTLVSFSLTADQTGDELWAIVRGTEDKEN